MKTFKTASLPLAAAILTEISGCDFQINSDRTIDGKAIIRLFYPDSEENNLKKIVTSYGKKELLVNLYQYNRNLNVVRNVLFSKGTRNAR